MAVGMSTTIEIILKMPRIYALFYLYKQVQIKAYVEIKRWYWHTQKPNSANLSLENWCTLNITIPPAVLNCLDSRT